MTPLLCFSPVTPLHAAGIRVDPPPSPRAPLTASRLGAAVPPELLRRMGQATRAADIELLVALIDEVRRLAPDVAPPLQELAAHFDYEALLALFEPSARSSPG